MFTITYIAAGVPPLVLARTSRDWMETEFKVNHKPVYTIEKFFDADYALGRADKNRRNVVSFLAFRGLDETETAFKDAEQAAVFMIDHGPSIAATGILKVEMKGSATNTVRYFQNAMFDTAEPVGEIGVTQQFRYVFNCGRSTKTNS